MTKKSVQENCERVCKFFKMDDKFLGSLQEKIDKCSSAMDLLNLYEMICDFNGAATQGLTTLYLTGEDYIEMKEHSKLNFEKSFVETNPEYHPEHFMFEHHYFWHVVNR